MTTTTKIAGEAMTDEHATFKEFRAALCRMNDANTPVSVADRVMILSNATFLLEEYARALLASKSADPTQSCVCGEPTTANTIHRQDGPCYIAPASPSGEDGAEQSAAREAATVTEGWKLTMYALSEAISLLYPRKQPTEKFSKMVEQARIAYHDALAAESKTLPRASEQADEAVTYVERRIPDGWRLYSADFSVSGSPGSVTLIRDEQGKAWWHGLTDEEREKIDLFITGRGKTIREAIDAARTKDSK